MQLHERIFRRQILNPFQLALMMMRYRYLWDPNGDIQVFA